MKYKAPLATIGTAALFLSFGKTWLADFSNVAWFGFMLTWLFAVVLIASFTAVQHAEAIAARLGEPAGTLVLTLTITAIGVALIATVMDAGDSSSELARDAIFAVVMIVLNAILGLSRLLGGLRRREQDDSFGNANDLLGAIAVISVLGLVLPNFVLSAARPAYSSLAAFLVVTSTVLYVAFLAIQGVRRRGAFSRTPHGMLQEMSGDMRSPAYHAGFLVFYVASIALLAKELAVVVNYGIQTLHAPSGLGGLLVSALVLARPAVSAVRVALANQVQQAVPLLLGLALGSLSLMIPAVIATGFITGRSIPLGLDAADTAMLALTLIVCKVTLVDSRGNSLVGAVHVVLFLAYVMLIFAK